MKKLLFIIFIVSSAFILTNCDDTITVVDVDNRVIPDSNVSFSEHIYPVFQVKCASSGCHVGPNPPAGLDLTSWGTATADPNIIFPGEPDQSTLIWSIEGNVPTIQPMPPVGFSVLTDNQITGIRTWIKEGALNN